MPKGRRSRLCHIIARPWVYNQSDDKDNYGRRYQGNDDECRRRDLFFCDIRKADSTVRKVEGAFIGRDVGDCSANCNNSTGSLLSSARLQSFGMDETLTHTMTIQSMRYVRMSRFDI